MNDQLLDTWRIHARINLYILDAIPTEAFEAPAPQKGRSFPDMLGHIHNVRLMWLQAGDPSLLEGLEKLPKDHASDPARLSAALEASGAAIERLLEDALEAGSRVKGFKPHTPAFLGYLISHEAYHHGEVGIALAEAGFPLDRKVAYGMWEWGSR